MLIVAIAAYVYGATMIAANAPPINTVLTSARLNSPLAKTPRKIAEMAKTAAKVMLESIYVTAFASQPKADSATSPLKAFGVNSLLVFK